MAKIGPMTREMFVAKDHKKIPHILPDVSKRSSILPDMTTLGTEPRTPVTKRQMKTAAMLFVAPTGRLKML